MPIQLPTYVMLDTSGLIELAGDLCGKSGDDAQIRARGFLERLEAESRLLFLTGHHFLELLGTNDDVEMGRRLGMIRSLPLVAWIRSWSEPPGNAAGTVFDIDAHELNAVIHDRASTRQEVLDRVRSQLIYCGKGADIAGAFSEYRDILGPAAKAIQKRGHEVVSLNRGGDAEIQGMTLREIYALPLREKKELSAALRQQAQTLERQMREHGDHRLTEPSEVAAELTRSVAATSMELTGTTVPEVAEQICAHFGVPMEMVHLDMTVGEIGELAIFAAHFRKVAPRLGLDLEKVTLKDACPHLCPSWQLRKAIGKCQGQAPRVQGGDLDDAYFAAMALYVDLVQVDKRTHEYVRQVRQTQPELAAHMREISKGRYFELLSAAGTESSSIPD